MKGADFLLKERIQAEIERGFLTTAYLECGWLDRPEPLMHIFSSKEPSSGHIFDLASLTKALVTGPLVHQYLEAHHLSRFDAVRCWTAHPERLNLPDHLLCLTADELLGHSSGLPAWWNFWMHQLPRDSEFLSPQDRWKHMSQVLSRIPVAPDKKEIYSDVGFILLGYLLEKIENVNLAELFKRLQLSISPTLCEDLGFLAQLKVEKINFVPTGTCNIRKRALQGEVHDENCAALEAIAGHAGLFASGAGLGCWLKALYRHPLGSHYLETNEKVRLATDRESLLGLRRGQGRSAALFCAGQGMGHLGFTGTAFWLELKSRKYAVFLSNRVISGRISAAMTELRRDVFQLLDACLAEI